MEAFPKLPNMEFGTTKKEMALEHGALALTILEASGVWQFFHMHLYCHIQILNLKTAFPFPSDAESICSVFSSQTAMSRAFHD